MVLTIRSRQSYRCSSVIVELTPLPLLMFPLLLSLISKLMVTCLDDRMVNSSNGLAGAEGSQGNGNLPPPPSLAQAIASILESCDEQTEMLRQLVANSTRGGNGARNAPAPTTYSDFAATHPPLFTKAGEPLEADHYLRVMESKFGLLRCTKVQRPSSPCSSCVVTSARGGPITPPLSLWTTKCHGRSSVRLSTPTTSPRA
jgi:hypothetical protein